MWWPFREKVKEDPKKVLEGLLKAKELLDKRFEMKQMTNESYLQRAKDLNKKIEKYQKRISEL